MYNCCYCSVCINCKRTVGHHRLNMCHHYWSLNLLWTSQNRTNGEQKGQSICCWMEMHLHLNWLDEIELKNIWIILSDCRLQHNTLNGWCRGCWCEQKLKTTTHYHHHPEARSGATTRRSTTNIREPMNGRTSKLDETYCASERMNDNWTNLWLN